MAASDLNNPFSQEPAGDRSIAAAPTTIAAFIGIAQEGPAHQPVKLNSVADFVTVFGALSPGIEAGYAISQFFKNGGREAWFVRVGRDSRALDLVGNIIEKTGIYALEQVPCFNFLCIPGLSHLPDRELLTALENAVSYCESRRAMFLLDLPSEIVEPNGAKRWIKDHEAVRHPNLAIYFPTVRIPDPQNMDKTRLVGPGGTVAGVLSRNDLNHGVWKDPGSSDLQLAGAVGLGYNLAQKEIELLDSLGINCLRKTEELGPIVSGGKTVMGAEHLQSEWRSLSVRRFTLFIQESLHQGTMWVASETNDEALWSAIRGWIAAFMDTLYRADAFQGQTPEEAYFVKCDQETTTRADIIRGVVNILVGFAPTTPGKFIFIQLARKTRKS